MYPLLYELSGTWFVAYVVLRGRDPSAVAVLLEDSAAVTGIILATTAIGLSHITDNSVYDAIGSIAIGGTASVSIITMQFHICMPELNKINI